jgi:signal transduction histidine kinase
MIVRELTQAHGGTFCVSTGFTRGFRVVLKFPVWKEKPGDVISLK